MMFFPLSIDLLTGPPIFNMCAKKFEAHMMTIDNKPFDLFSELFQYKVAQPIYGFLQTHRVDTGRMWVTVMKMICRHPHVPL